MIVACALLRARFPRFGWFCPELRLVPAVSLVPVVEKGGQEDGCSHCGENAGTLPAPAERLLEIWCVKTDGRSTSTHAYARTHTHGVTANLICWPFWKKWFWFAKTRTATAQLYVVNLIINFATFLHKFELRVFFFRIVSETQLYVFFSERLVP